MRIQIHLVTLTLALAIASGGTTAKQRLVLEQTSLDQAQGVVRVLVDKRGNAVEIIMLRSSGDRETDRAIIHGAKRLKVEPASGQTKPQEGWHELPVRLVAK